MPELGTYGSVRGVPVTGIPTAIANSGGTSTKAAPTSPRRYTPSSTRQCRWMFRLAADPKRWIKVTAPRSA